MQRVLPASVRLINDKVLSIFATSRFLFTFWLHVRSVSTIYNEIVRKLGAREVWNRAGSKAPLISNHSSCTKGVCDAGSKPVTLMLPDEFLFFLFLLRLLLDEFLIDIDVLISYLLWDGLNFCRFLDQLLLHILHEERRSCLSVMRVASWKGLWSSKNSSSITGHARGI